MADQVDAAALAELGEQLYDASQDGEAAEAARLLDLNAPINHRVGELQWTPLMICLLYTSPSPRDRTRSRMPSSA